MTKLCTVTDEIAAKIKAENPGIKLRVCRYDDAEVILRPASREQYQHYLDSREDDRKKGSSSAILVYACVVFPPEKDLNAVLEQRPGLITIIGNDAGELSGLKAAAEKKDL